MAKQEIFKKEIRLDIIVAIMLKNWRGYVLPLAMTAIVTIVIVLMIPRYYNVTVKLAPEYGAGGSGLSGLASSFGIDLGNMDQADAIVPLYYPDVIGSTQFCVPLFDVKVQCRNSEFEGTFCKYIQTHVKSTPWAKAYVELRKLLSSNDKSVKGAIEPVDPFNLTRMENKVYLYIKNNITCTVDKKTDIITLAVTAQDPLVAAQLADSVMQHLQDFIINYRTRKVRIDLQHYKEIRAEKQQVYEHLRDNYLSHADSNRDIVVPSLRKRTQDREIELQEAYEELALAKKQLAITETKLTERTPAFTVLQNSTVPLKPAGPKRMIIVAAMMLMVFFVCSVRFILKAIKDDQVHVETTKEA